MELFILTLNSLTKLFKFLVSTSSVNNFLSKLSILVSNFLLSSFKFPNSKLILV